MSHEGSSGYRWAASPYNATNGWCLYFGSGDVVPQDSNTRRLGYPLRCIQGFALCVTDNCFSQDEDVRKYDSRNFGLPQC